MLMSKNIIKIEDIPNKIKNDFLPQGNNFFQPIMSNHSVARIKCFKTICLSLMHHSFCLFHKSLHFERRTAWRLFYCKGRAQARVQLTTCSYRGT